MAQNDDAVLTAAVGYVFTNTAGSAAPTPAEVAAFDPALFGAKVLTLTVTGAPTSLKLVVGAGTTTALPIAATAAAVQAALEALSTVGVGNVKVTGTNFTSGLDVAIVGSKLGTSLTITATDFVAGSTPALVVTVETDLNGWGTVGHTAEGDLPEFGFDGGSSEVRGTWQKKKLREITTEDPIDFLTIFLQQFDETALSLYYGENASADPGVFGVSADTAAANEKSFFVVIVDGDFKLGFHAHKASVKRDDSIQLATDEFGSLPIKATFLQHSTELLFSWINTDLFNAA